MHNKPKLWMRTGFWLGVTTVLAVACSSSTDPGEGGLAGSTSSAGTGLGGSSTTGGTANAAAGTLPATAGTTSVTGGASGSSSMAGTASGGTPTQAGTGGMVTGGAPSGGAPSGGAGGTGAGGKGGAGGTGGSGGTGGGTSGPCANGATAKPCPPTEPNSIAYIGCSMADNIGQGYSQVGGKIMWTNSGYPTGAKVVENWGPSGDGWSLFNTKLNAIGGKDKVKAIMVQICLLSTHSEANVKAMIQAARDRLNPGTHIYLVGQPGYEAGHECFLAGDDGAKWADDTAKKLAMDSSVNQNLTYLGQFKLDTTKGESSDGCHASAAGMTVLGNQAKAFWGG
jgi:hypothetical protein